MTTLSDYYDMLSKHDWYYNFSDDNSRFNKGSDGENLLERVALESPAHAKLFEDFVNYAFSTQAFGKDKARVPCPTRPGN